ncbi:uncharacterized protein LOC129756454 [Uranotaenia lowii]|uniref:uncharacterized protein LOC129756454 n=1 Tax=Uranotaenia lowii TaxID=190385 RepID=UPI00247B2803|nr:uncharacterized protein LOC129756454 [Uranotaenia lowii]
MFQFLIYTFLAIALVNGEVKVDQKSTVKRGLDGGANFGFGSPNGGVGLDFWQGSSKIIAGPWIQSSASGWKHGPTPAEIAAAIAAAKQASAQVLIAQHQVQAAKENVLNQQKIANEKEANAAYASQKSEATAAVQRSEAAAAAQAVILAQHRLAAAKANVAQHQRIAAAKESVAAQAIQSSAKAAAAEIHRAEAESTKLAAHHRSDAASLNHHLVASKDEAFAPLIYGGNQIPTSHLLRSATSIGNPWADWNMQLPWLSSSNANMQGFGGGFGGFGTSFPKAIWG